MVRWGLASLDEVEEMENRESNAVVEAQVNFAVDVVDWNAVFDTLPELGPVVDPDSFGGIPVLSPGSGGS